MFRPARYLTRMSVATEALEQSSHESVSWGRNNQKGTITHNNPKGTKGKQTHKMPKPKIMAMEIFPRFGKLAFHTIGTGSSA